jgi:carbon-monoxide dehydrogenase small subunit
MDPFTGKTFTSEDAFKQYLTTTYPGITATLTSLNINGASYTLVNLQPNWSLAYVMREKLNFVGTKRGCDMGECGVCTIIMNNRPIFSCMVLAVEADGATIQTIESLDQNGTLDPIQQAFMTYDATQCGFCTPGQIMTVKALLNVNPNPTAAQIQQALAGNLCRCSCYVQILAAVLSVSKA